MSVSPPRPKTPPLNALRAFEAAARLGGFRAAAAELCVTPGAISQQIKTLEDWAGAQLFERRVQGVVLSPLGQRVTPMLREAFDGLGMAARTLRSGDGAPAVAIAALPSIAQLWLPPRLSAIRAAVPGARLSVTALDQEPNLRREMFDLSVFLGPVPDGAAVLVPDVIFPVCTRELAARLHGYGDLSGETLLHDALWSGDWALWRDSVAPGVELPLGGPVFSLYSVALEEALRGAGVLMAHAALVAGPLESGALVAPFAERVETGGALYAQVAPGSELGAAILAAIARS